MAKDSIKTRETRFYWAYLPAAAHRKTGAREPVILKAETREQAVADEKRFQAKPGLLSDSVQIDDIVLLQPEKLRELDEKFEGLSLPRTLNVLAERWLRKNKPEWFGESKRGWFR